MSGAWDWLATPAEVPRARIVNELHLQTGVTGPLMAKAFFCIVTNRDSRHTSRGVATHAQNKGGRLPIPPAGTVMA